jgi:hypothetical protein
MANIRVSILHPNGAQKTTAEIPDNVVAQRLVKALVDRMGLPQTGQNGRPISYRLTYTRDSQENELNPEETLGQAGVQNEDMLRLYAQMEGGTSIPGDGS